MKTLKDVQSSKVGEVIDAFKGTIVDVKRWFPADPKLDRSHSTQLIIFGEGLERLNAIVRGRKEIPPGNMGKRFCILAKPQNGTHVGIEVRSKDGIAALLITKDASFTTIQDMSVSDAEEEAEFGPVEKETPAESLTPVDAEKQAVLVLGRAGCAMRMALGMAIHTETWFKTQFKRPMDPDQFRVITSTYFIHLNQSGLITFLSGNDPNDAP